MPKLFTSSVAMLVVLFCQITTFFLAPDTPNLSAIAKTLPGQTKQLSILGANLPVLAPGKRLEPLAKNKPSGSGPMTAAARLCVHNTDHPHFDQYKLISTTPVPTKYWLIHRALLL
jgi:hypothetical protein